MTHPNNMTAWDTIECRRSCDVHHSRWADINLATHRYADLTPIPPRFHRRFTMEIWDTELHPVDGGPYCPARDAVSETILSHGVWEPRETAVMLSCLERFDGAMFDMGAQLGWFSLIAGLGGADVTAWECDRDNRDRLRSSAARLEVAVSIVPNRIGPDTEPLPPTKVAFAKIDLEGAERDAVRILWPSIDAGLVDSMLIEVSPVFDDYYGDMVAGIMENGYEAFMMPPKRFPPYRIDTLDDLASWRLNPEGVVATVDGWHQEDVLFVRKGAL